MVWAVRRAKEMDTYIHTLEKHNPPSDAAKYQKKDFTSSTFILYILNTQILLLILNYLTE